MRFRLRYFMLLLSAMSVMNIAKADTGCGNVFVNAYGPFDYRDPNARERDLPVVERYHFHEKIHKVVNIGVKDENFLPRRVIADLDYTLRAFPNHHKALEAMGKYQLTMMRTNREKLVQLLKQYRTADCYFQRAIEFKPDDPGVYAVYGIYLFRTNKLDKSLPILQRAEELSYKNADVFYTMGLAYLKKKDLENARQYAKKAYDLGYPLPFLRDQLKRSGVWTTSNSKK